MLPSSFADIAPRVDAATCTVCRGRLAPGDRAVVAHIVAGVGRHHGRTVAFLNDEDNCELAHVDCRNPKLNRPRILMPASSSVGAPVVRSSDAACPVCGVAFRRGDRVARVAVVIGVEKDPETKRPAAKCHTDFEHVHLNCRDPQLASGLLVAS